MGNHFAISTTAEGNVSGSVHKKVLMNTERKKIGSVVYESRHFFNYFADLLQILMEDFLGDFIF